MGETGDPVSGPSGEGGSADPTRADHLLVALNELERLQHEYKYVLGAASGHLHLAIVEMQRATADALLNERRRVEQATISNGSGT